MFAPAIMALRVIPRPCRACNVKRSVAAIDKVSLLLESYQGVWEKLGIESVIKKQRNRREDITTNICERE